jgi:hypothetical protein
MATEQETVLRNMSLGLGVTLVDLTEARLLLGVDRRENIGISATGKTIVFSRYFGAVPGTDLVLNLTLYRKNPDYVEPKKRRSAPSEGKSTTGEQTA